MNALTKSIYLDSFLAPLAPYMAREEITDIYVNRSGELWIESIGAQVQRIEDPALTQVALSRLARQVAAISSQGVSREHPLLAASLPDGSRIQIALPPATRGEIALAIRKHVVQHLTLDAYEAQGAFATSDADIRQSVSQSSSRADRRERSTKDLLRSAVRTRRNIIIAGGTSTGKTTFLNALLREISPKERLILIEDTPELQMTHSNSVGLIAARSPIGEAAVNAEDLLIASLRMRPDRVILGELRGGEAMTFLRAINTGHPGSMTTIHADSPERAVDQLAMLVLQGGNRMSWENVVSYVRRSIDVFVQLKRNGGVRSVETVSMTY